MASTDKQKLLKNKKVVEEINRHRWIESERAGCDIGFEKASIDWLEKFSVAWMQYHMPNRKVSSSTPSNSAPTRKPSSRKTSQKAKGQTRPRTKKS